MLPYYRFDMHYLIKNLLEIFSILREHQQSPSHAGRESEEHHSTSYFLELNRNQEKEHAQDIAIINYLKKR